MRIIKHLSGLMAGAYSGYAIAKLLYLSKISVANIVYTNIEFNPTPFIIGGGIIGLTMSGNFFTFF